MSGQGSAIGCHSLLIGIYPRVGYTVVPFSGVSCWDALSRTVANLGCCLNDDADMPRLHADDPDAL